MLGQMAIAMALPEFNDLGRTVTPGFLLMIIFSPNCLPFAKKMKKICRLQVKFFAKCTIEFRTQF